MGVWGVKPFENDEALDLVANLEEKPARGRQLIVDSLAKYVKGKGYLTYVDIPALAELVYAAYSTDVKRLPSNPKLRRLITSVHITPEDVALAREAVSKAIGEYNPEEWPSARNGEALLRGLHDLRTRLGQGGTSKRVVNPVDFVTRPWRGVFGA